MGMENPNRILSDPRSICKPKCSLETGGFKRTSQPWANKNQAGKMYDVTRVAIEQDLGSSSGVRCMWCPGSDQSARLSPVV